MFLLRLNSCPAPFASDVDVFRAVRGRVADEPGGHAAHEACRAHVLRGTSSGKPNRKPLLTPLLMLQPLPHSSSQVFFCYRKRVTGSPLELYCGDQTDRNHECGSSKTFSPGAFPRPRAHVA